MLGWLVRLLLLAAGLIAGWFVPEGDLGYMLIQFVVVLIFILISSVGTLYYLRLAGQEPETAGVGVGRQRGTLIIRFRPKPEAGLYWFSLGV